MYRVSFLMNHFFKVNLIVALSHYNLIKIKKQTLAFKNLSLK